MPQGSVSKPGGGGSGRFDVLYAQGVKLEQQVGRIFTKATNSQADLVIARTQQGKPHDEKETIELLKIKMSAIEQAILLIASKVDDLTHPAADEDAESPIGK